MAIAESVLAETVIVLAAMATADRADRVAKEATTADHAGHATTDLIKKESHSFLEWDSFLSKG